MLTILRFGAGLAVRIVSDNQSGLHDAIEARCAKVSRREHPSVMC